VLYLSVVNFRAVYFLMWACIPLSTELEFPGGLATDFPAEGLMVLLTGITVLWCVRKLKTASLTLLLHPVSLLILLLLGWISLTTITSSDHVLSVKFLLAKIWYIVPFYLLGYILLGEEKEIRKWFYWVLIPMLATVGVIFIRHGMEGFRFEVVNEVLKPFYRNHVDYALILGVFFPFVAVMYDRWLARGWGILVCGVLLFAVYMTYTRAAYLGLAIALAGILLTRWHLVRYTMIAGVLVACIALVGLSKDNRYIDYAPDYYKTITHYRFGNLLEATYRLEDVSTMERFYRWIAAFYMVQERPLTGFGPNNFVSFYKPYADQHFVTYVSDNPEQSGVHNYFLMTVVEQGLPGLIIFLGLLFITLLRAEWLYHRLKDGFYRKLLCGVIGSMFFILFALTLNDMIETDKVGSFFFLNLAFLAIIERNARTVKEFITNPAEKK
jgi:O-antigen ligase